MSNFVCTKPCFIKRRFLPGDVVDGEVADVIPSCFKSLKSINPAAIEAEIERVVPEVAERKPGRPKAVTMSEIKGKTPEQFT